MSVVEGNLQVIHTYGTYILSSSYYGSVDVV